MCNIAGRLIVEKESKVGDLDRRELGEGSEPEGDNKIKAAFIVFYATIRVLIYWIFKYDSTY